MKAVIQLFFKSIYGKMLLAVIIGAVAAAALFLSLDYLGNYMVDTHFASQKVDDRLDKKYAAKLQEYAVENQVRSDDRKALDAWVKKHDLIYIRADHTVYRRSCAGVPGGILLLCHVQLRLSCRVGSGIYPVSDHIDVPGEKMDEEDPAAS